MIATIVSRNMKQRKNCLCAVVGNKSCVAVDDLHWSANFNTIKDFVLGKCLAVGYI